MLPFSLQYKPPHVNYQFLDHSNRWYDTCNPVVRPIKLFVMSSGLVTAKTRVSMQYKISPLTMGTLLRHERSSCILMKGLFSPNRNTEQQKYIIFVMWGERSSLSGLSSTCLSSRYTDRSACMQNCGFYDYLTTTFFISKGSDISMTSLILKHVENWMRGKRWVRAAPWVFSVQMTETWLSNFTRVSVCSCRTRISDKVCVAQRYGSPAWLPVRIALTIWQ